MIPPGKASTAASGAASAVAVIIVSSLRAPRGL
jgi:hypothetical protein